MTRLLAWLDGDDPETWSSKLLVFERVFVMTVGVEYWARAIPKWSTLGPLYLAALGIATLACMASAVPHLARGAFAVLALTQAAVIAAEFPATGNHAYLELYFLALLALLRPDDPDERRLLMRALRWLVVLVLFTSGFQKLVHGYYFRGQYLAYSLGTETFRPVLAPLLSAGELARLTSFPSDVGSGPYLVSSPLLLLVSNAIWIAELALPVLLLWPPARAVAVAGTLALLAGIEVGARELFFGLVFTNGVLLFLPGRIGGWYPALVAVLLAWMLLGSLGIVPSLVFH